MPEARLINMYVEGTPHGPNADARYPRPALVAFLGPGDGPIRGLYSQPGVFDGDIFVISGIALYRLSDSMNLGAISGTDMVRFAASATQLVIVSSGMAYTWDGTTLAQITDPDLPSVSDVAYLAGRFVFTVEGSDRFYYTEVNDAETIDALSFATAESLADPNVAVQALGDELYFFGQKSVEPWYVTGDDPPFAPTQGRQYIKGCASRDTIVELDNALYFLGADPAVYRAAATPRRVSDHGIEERLRRCTDLAACTAFGAVIDGHSFYVLNIAGQGSFCHDVENADKGWSEWTSFGRTVFKARCSVLVDGVNYVGDDADRFVYTLSPDVYLDVADPITFLASAFIPYAGGPPVRHDNLVLQGARGVGLATGYGSAPVVEMRYSDDQGKTWCNWRSASVGAVGQYAQRPVWQRLGLVREPGRHLEFRMSDPVLASMSGVLVNVRRPHG